MRGVHQRVVSDARGFSLIEVMVAAIISVIAVVGLAYSFSAGRGLIDRFATARDALETAGRRLEILAMEARKDPANADLAAGNHGPFGLTLNQNQTGSEAWYVAWVDDPVDNGGGDLDPNDYKRVTVKVRWNQASLPDSVVLSRSFLGP
jgi:prepilin-type N-terminal cleavage/methylation domain-containing protein